MIYYDDITPDVTCNVADDYQGHCKVLLDGRVNRSVVLPSLEEAQKVASMALDITIGGYSEATIEETSEPTTHDTAMDWLID